MGELIRVNHIDLGVHFDYLRKVMPGIPMQPEAAERFQRCEDRVRKISADSQSVMFFFSTYLERDEQERLVTSYHNTEFFNHEAFGEEEDRLKSYQKMLGSRFFLFAGWDTPRISYLQHLFESRGFAYDPQATSLLAYGEWLNDCVKGIAKHIQNTMELDPENCYLDPNLSLAWEQDHLTESLYPGGRKIFIDRTPVVSKPKSLIASLLQPFRKFLVR